jgi:hypothetical protein
VYRAGQPGAFNHAAGRCADARRRPDAPHVGPDLRVPEPHQRRRRRTAAFASTPSRPRASRRWSTGWRECRSSSRPAPAGTTASRTMSSATS